MAKSVKYMEMSDLAERLLAYFSTQDPTWADRIAITRNEHNWDALQTLGNYVADVLDGERHLNIASNPMFESQFGTAMDEVTCKACEKPFMPEYPGKFLCSNECAVKFYGKGKTDAQVQADNTAERAKQLLIKAGLGSLLK